MLAMGRPSQNLILYRLDGTIKGIIIYGIGNIFTISLAVLPSEHLPSDEWQRLKKFNDDLRSVFDI